MAPVSPIGLSKLRSSSSSMSARELYSTYITINGTTITAVKKLVDEDPTWAEMCIKAFGIIFGPFFIFLISLFIVAIVVGVINAEEKDTRAPKKNDITSNCQNAIPVIAYDNQRVRPTVTGTFASVERSNYAAAAKDSKTTGSIQEPLPVYDPKSPPTYSYPLSQESRRKQ
ncbi:hypothetical protein CJJ07_000733 [Candidozyma auris]|nr:hypothetical protein CJJ07_000733 [[Candida] auris]